MLISREAKKIVLHLKNPERITTVIPTAREFEYRGERLVSVPHRIEEVRVLANMGIQAPSPIEYQYKWSGSYTPFDAQRATSAFLTVNPKAFCLSEMGTGKSLATLWAYDYLRNIGKARKMLVISPLSTLERTWADEIFRHFTHLNIAVLHGSKERRRKLLAADADIYLINHDGIKTIEAELIARTDIDVVVVDEIASFRNATTTRWKCLRKVCDGRAYLWGLTGTPTPNLPTDAWAQCRLISPERVPLYFGKFKESVLKQVGPFKWLPRETATDTVANAMQPSIRFTRDECVDLPPSIYIDRTVRMTPEQTKAYNQMRSKLMLEYETQQVKAVNEAVKMAKLVQIACGVVYGADGAEIVLPNDPRVEVLREVIEEAGTKTIVYVPFKGVMRHLAERLSGEFDVAVVSGDTTKTQRDDIFNRFQNTSEIRVLIAQPAAMSHGLTLTAASTVVWYAPVTSNEIYQQANARITRPGQKHTQLIVNIEASEVERRIYERLKNKQTMQGLLLEAIGG